jgi:hypothetical protein
LVTVILVSRQAAGKAGGVGAADTAAAEAVNEFGVNAVMVVLPGNPQAGDNTDAPISKPVVPVRSLTTTLVPFMSTVALSVNTPGALIVAVPLRFPEVVVVVDVPAAESPAEL